MSDYVFLFDLDSTITREEILPKISALVDKEKEMRWLTEQTMLGEIPFKDSFLKRIELLRDIEISKVQDIVANVSLNHDIVRFINQNREKCYIVTGNLDIWIDKLITKLDMKDRTFSSIATQKNNYLDQIVFVIEKEFIAKQMVSNFIAVGDGSNDLSMLELAEIGIGYGGARDISPILFGKMDFAFYDEKKMSEFLKFLSSLD